MNMRLFFIFISYFYIHVINVNLSDCYNHAVLCGMVTALLHVIQFPLLQHECECIILFLGHVGPKKKNLPKNRYSIGVQPYCCYPLHTFMDSYYI